MRRRSMKLHRWAGVVAAVMGVAVSREAKADPVVVLPVFERERGPSPETLTAVQSAVGSEALAGAPLSEAIGRAVGRYVPREDALASQRTAVRDGMALFFADNRALRRRGLSGTGPVESRRALAAAVTAMEASPEALELGEENRTAYLQALAMLARIDSEAHQDPQATAWVEKARRFDGRWVPPSEEFPPAVVRLFAGDANARAEAELEVRLPREGCTVTVDGRALPGTAAEVHAMRAVGVHRVSAQCGSETSRVRLVTLATGTRRTVRIDPRLDELVRVSPTAALSYATGSDVQNAGPSDAAALGEALGASHVVMVTRERATVIVVANGQSRASVAVQDASLAVQVRAGLRGEASFANETTPPSGAIAPEGPVRPRRSVVPWVLAGVGAVALGVGGAMFYLRSDRLSQAESLCPSMGGALQCPDMVASNGAEAFRSEASTFTIAGAVAGGVGVVLLGVGLGWGLSQRSSQARPTATVVPGGGAMLGLTGRF